MKRVGIVGGAVALILVAAAVSAQSLGELAKQEAERRKNVKTSGKVYTNDTVRPDPNAPAPASGQAAEPKAPAATTTPSNSQPPAAAPPTPDETKTEAYWKKRITATREALSRAQTFAEALQTRINVLSADFVNRDDPAQRNVVAADRQKAMDELARLNKEIQQHQKAITDIQDEARRANVPAGWVR